MKKFLTLISVLLPLLGFAGCKTTNSNSGSQGVNADTGVSDGFSGNGNRRGNTVRKAFNTFRR